MEFESAKLRTILDLLAKHKNVELHLELKKGVVEQIVFSFTVLQFHIKLNLKPMSLESTRLIILEIDWSNGNKTFGL